VAGGYYLGANKQPRSPQIPTQLSQLSSTPTPTSIPSTIPTVDSSITANWKTYENIKYRYSITYPPQATHEETNFMGSRNKQETATIFRVNGGMLEIAGNKGGMGIAPINSKEIDALFDQILSTFRFVE